MVAYRSESVATFVPEEFISRPEERDSVVNVFGTEWSELDLLSNSFETIRDSIIMSQVWSDVTDDSDIYDHLSSFPENLKLMYCIAASFNLKVGRYEQDPKKCENGRNYRTERLAGLKQAISFVCFREVPKRLEEQLLNAWSPYNPLQTEENDLFYEDDSETHGPPLDYASAYLRYQAPISLAAQSSKAACSTSPDLSYMPPEVKDMIVKKVWLWQEYYNHRPTVHTRSDKRTRGDHIRSSVKALQNLRLVSKGFHTPATEYLFRSYTFRPQCQQITSVCDIVKFEQRTGGPGAKYVRTLNIRDLWFLEELGQELGQIFPDPGTTVTYDPEALRVRQSRVGEVWLTKALESLFCLKTITISAGPLFYEMASILSKIQHNVSELSITISTSPLHFDPPSNLGVDNQGRNFFKKVKALRIDCYEHAAFLRKPRSSRVLDPIIEKIANLTRLDLRNSAALVGIPLSVGLLPKLDTINLTSVDMSAEDLMWLLESGHPKEVHLKQINLTSGFWAPIIRCLTELVGRSDFHGSFEELGYQISGPCWKDFKPYYVNWDDFRDDRFGTLRSVNPSDRLAWSAFLKTKSPNLANGGIAGPEPQDLQSSRVNYVRCAAVKQITGRCKRRRPLKSDEVPGEDVWLCKAHANQGHILRLSPYYGSDLAESKYHWDL